MILQLFKVHVFLSYQDSERLVIKGFIRWSPILQLQRCLPPVEIKSRPVAWQASAQPTELHGL